MHRQHVDDVGEFVADGVPVAEKLRGDRVTVGLVVEQDSAEVVASRRTEGVEKVAEVVAIRHVEVGGGRPSLAGWLVVA